MIKVQTDKNSSDDSKRRQMKLRSNTHGCELINICMCVGGIIYKHRIR